MTLQCSTWVSSPALVTGAIIRSFLEQMIGRGTSAAKLMLDNNHKFDG
jgi:hypothetical protein